MLHIGVHPHGHEGVAEVGVAPGAAAVAARREVVLRRRIHQIAIRNEIAVAVGPAAVGRLLERHRRIVDGVLVAVLRGLQVFADVHLHGRLAVAEEIVGGAHPRRDVVVAGHAVLSREDEAAAELIVGGDAVFVGGEEARRVLVARRGLHREASVRPLILRVEAVVARAVALIVGADPHRELVGHAVVERVAQLVVDVHRLPIHLVRRLVAELEAVRAGHVGQRRAPDVVLLIVGRRRIPAAIGEVGVGHAGRGALLGHGDETRAARPAECSRPTCC